MRPGLGIQGGDRSLQEVLSVSQILNAMKSAVELSETKRAKRHAVFLGARDRPKSF